MLAAVAVAIATLIALIFVAFRTPPPPAVVVVTPPPALTQTPYPTYTPYPTPITEIVWVTQIVRITQVIPVTQIISTPVPQQILQKEVMVYAKSDWQNTDIFVQEGKTVVIKYVSGKWAIWSGYYVDGRGCLDEPICTQDPNYRDNVFSFRHGGLIGRIGDRTFAVGNSATIVAPVSGFVYLRINDKVINDNSGAITVHISVSQ